MELVKEYKILGLCLGIAILCELIGPVQIAILPILPMLYAIIVGGVISIPKLKILSENNMKRASAIMNIALVILVVKLSLLLGPSLGQLKDASLALVFQEVGHFIGTILLGLPIAVALGLGREAVGATYSIGREPNIAIVAERYTLDSPEGRGVMAIYILGTVFGAWIVAILASIFSYLDILHPYALAMGIGVGSGSMLAAGLGALVSEYPEMEKNITTYATAANLMSSILGLYIYMFISLPVASRMYYVFRRLFGYRDVSLEKGK